MLRISVLLCLFALSACQNPSSIEEEVVLEWQDPISISSGSYNAELADVAMDNHGNVAVVWLEDDASGGTRSIWARLYQAASDSWGFSHRVENSSETIPATSKVHVSADQQGGFFIAWVQGNGSSDVVYAGHHDGAAWSLNGPLSASGIFVKDVRLVSDDNGSAILVWEENLNIQAAKFNTTTGWPMGTRIDNAPPGSSVYTPDIAVDGQGNYTAVWDQFDGVDHSIHFNRFSSASWAGAVALSVQASGVERPAIAMSAEGNAVCAWRQQSGLDTFIYASYHQTGQGWSTASRMDTGLSDSGNAAVVMAWEGKALVLWQAAASGYFANYFDGNSWLTSPATVSPSSAIANAPALASNGMSVRAGLVDSSAVRAYVWQNSAWQPDQNLSQHPSQFGDVAMTMNSSGETALVWYEDSPVQSIKLAFYR